ncbi:MAG: thioesterase domain-containing protein [Anaerolineae bacterium]
MTDLNQSHRWLAVGTLNPHARLRLFCFPYSGAGTTIFRAWSRSFPPEIEVCPVRLPGRENRIDEPPFRQMTALVQATAAALWSYLDRPFAFFGHSMGALLSFELARLLRRQYRVEPAQLFVSGHSAPHLRDTDSPCYALPEEEFVAKLRELHGTPDEVLDNAELRQLILPTLRADFEVCETYAYEEATPLDCPITALGGAQDMFVTRTALEAWAAHTHTRFNAQLLPGDHFFLHAAHTPLIRTIVQELASTLGLSDLRREYEPATLASAA